VLFRSVSYSQIDIPPTSPGSYTVNAKLIGTGCGGVTSGDFSFTINKAPITISNIVLTKVYDGTPNVNVISNSSSGSLTADQVIGVGQPTSFSDKIVANNYSLTVTFSLTSSVEKKLVARFTTGASAKLPFIVQPAHVTKCLHCRILYLLHYHLNHRRTNLC
jgi:hypothetical protein